MRLHKVLQKLFSGLQSQKTIYPSGHLQAIDLPANHSEIREIRCAEDGFDFLGKRILPIGVLPSQAALSRMQKNTVRLYEQGASKQRVWKYWVLWLGWIFGTGLSGLTYAGTCAGINTSSDTFCTCDTTHMSLPGSYAGTWAVNHYMQKDGNSMGESHYNVSYCLDGSDTICSESRPATLPNNSQQFSI
jgi:hypothetical protein